MPYITSFLDVFIISFLLFSRLTVSRLSDFKKILKKSPLIFLPLKLETYKERDRERKRETERDREKERHLKNWRNWRNYRKEKREKRKEKREESGHTVPAPLCYSTP